MRSEMRLAFIECDSCPFTLTVQGNEAVSGQSGVHWPFDPRESPPPLRPHETTLVLTGVTIGICSVRVVGTRLGSGSVALSMTDGLSKLGVELTTVNCMIGPTAGSLETPCSACASDTCPS